MLKQADATWVHAIAAGTGATRRQLPHWIDHLPPCNAACPAGENIQAWLEHARAGQWQQAWKQILDDNPFPAVHGRACYHPCQSKCNRGELDSAVGIHAVERLVGDVARKEKWQPSWRTYRASRSHRRRRSRWPLMRLPPGSTRPRR